MERPYLLETIEWILGEESVLGGRLLRGMDRGSQLA